MSAIDITDSNLLEKLIIIRDNPKLETILDALDSFDGLWELSLMIKTDSDSLYIVTVSESEMSVECVDR